MKLDATVGDNQGTRVLLVFVPITLALITASLALQFIHGVGGALVAIGCLAGIPFSLLLFARPRPARVGALVLTLGYLGVIAGVLILQAGQ